MKNQQEILNELYRIYILNSKDDLTKNDYEWNNLSSPLFVKIPDEYHKSKVKILFAGQETYGWGNSFFENQKLSQDDLIKLLLNEYEKFGLAKGNSKQPHLYNTSPFWRFCYKLYHQFNDIDDYSQGFIWSNLCRMSENKTTPSKNLRMILMPKSIELLVDEIRVVQPDIAVLAIGKKYDWYLNKYLDFSNDDYTEILPGRLYRFRNKIGSCSNIFKTYHPRYIERNKWTNEIISAITANSQDIS